MARIRTIKPEFCQSETIGALSRDARLCFVQLWTFVDDEGRCRAAPRVLAGALFPYDEDAPALMEGWIGELEELGCVFRYQIGGASFLQVRNWKKHQKIDRPSASRLPPPPDFDEPSMNPIEDSTQPRLPLDAGPRTVDLGPSISPDARQAREERDDLALAKFKDAYPKDVQGDGVRRELSRKLDQGVSLDEIIVGAKRYALTVAGKDSQFVASPVQWIRDGRWKDGQHKRATEPIASDRTHVKIDDPRWRGLDDRHKREKGLRAPTDNNNGWKFPNSWLIELHESVS